MTGSSKRASTSQLLQRMEHRRLCGGCSSRTLFYLVAGCAFSLVLFNFVIGRKELLLVVSGRDGDQNQVVILNGKGPDWALSTKETTSVGGIIGSPTHHSCDGFDGLYLISQGDIGGAAGTIFFQFVIGQILYAERYNLKPWVHLDNVSYVIYDPLVHGRGPGITFQALSGMNASHIVRPNGHWRDRVPGPPVKVGPVATKTFHLDGTGVWNHYFEPISDFQPGDKSCEKKPLVQMDMFLITPGIHGFAEWAPRCWRYQYAPDYMTKPHIPLHEWLEPQRIVANRVVQQYIKFKPDVLDAAQQANPDCSLPDYPCLGLHIRQSDKAAGRRQIQTHEFLPYAIAFIKAGGKAIYLATDSTKVLDEVKATWPSDIRNKLRTIGNNVIRSSDEKAVFDIGDNSHDRTNREILIEIVALANCQFMIHGLSAVTESSIWMNVALHDRSVNLEDPEFLSPMAFGTLVQMVLRNEPRKRWPSRRTVNEWWNAPPIVFDAHEEQQNQQLTTGTACQGYDGILLISEVGPKDTAGIAFFHSIMNQLLYADRNNLKPLIHLGRNATILLDEMVHSKGLTVAMKFQGESIIAKEHDAQGSSGVYPGKPAKVSDISVVKSLEGSGIWDNYFEPVSAEIKQGDKTCRQLPLISMESNLVSPGLSVWCPWCLRPWKFDGVPNHLWKPNDVKYKDWYAPMRKQGHAIVKKYFQFQPHIKRQAERINPTTDVNNTVIPCLAVHFRNSFKKGNHRQLIKAKEFQNYMEAFQRAGGQSIFIASDSHRVVELMTTSKEVPDGLQQIIKSQGPYVVRSSGGKKNKWLVNQLAEHHRINSEVLADILAMSKCHLFLHGFSSTSEAVFYLNPKLHENSVNMEDPDRLSPDGFEQLSRKVLQANTPGPQPSVDAREISSNLLARKLVNTTVLTRDPARLCKRNAIIYLAQKQHSTYGRDSYAIMMKSMNLMFQNYLSLSNHKNNTDLFIFHTGDFNGTDLLEIESYFGPAYHGIVRLVDLSGSTYWQRPSCCVNDDPLNPDRKKAWYAYPLFSEGYRHMMRWYAIGLWDFFDKYNQETGCAYRYLFRLDEDSYLHSPIRYDVFDQMEANNYVYGFRMCAYEMRVTQRILAIFKRKRANFLPKREIDLNMCGFYNNLFVADIQHFNSAPVQEFLRIVDKSGLIYRRRLGDLMLHSLSVYMFAPPERIHRFLDFTYQHATENQTSGCVVWGGIQAGYDDPNAEATLANYYQRQVLDLNCPINATFLSESDLSPSYAHVPIDLKGRLLLHSIMMGRVELPGKGILSG